MTATSANQPPRRPARHCAELFGTAIGTEKPATRFPEIAADLARALGPALGSLIGGARLRVSCSDPEPIAPAALAERIGPLAGNCVLSFVQGRAKLLVSLAAHDLLALTDRAFGGDGALPEALPEELPMTADLVAAQLESSLCRAFEEALPAFAGPHVASRSHDIARLDPFADQDECLAFTVIVTEAEQRDWSLVVAVTLADFDALFAARAEQQAAAGRSKGDPLAAPFADMPFEVQAVLAEFAMPLARLSSLKTGDTIPLSLSSEVPLKILETTIAYGSVGAMDERVALQITRAF